MYEEYKYDYSSLLNIKGFENFDYFIGIVSKFKEVCNDKTNEITNLICKQYIPAYIEIVKDFFYNNYKKYKFDDKKDIDSILYIVVYDFLRDIKDYKLSEFTDFDHFLKYSFAAIKYSFYDFLTKDSFYNVVKDYREEKEYIENRYNQTLDEYDKEALETWNKKTNAADSKYRVVKPVSIDNLNEKFNFYEIYSDPNQNNNVLNNMIEKEERGKIINKLDKFINTLNPRYKRIFMDYYFNKKSTKEIALKENVSHQMIGQIIDKIKKRIKEYFKLPSSKIRVYNRISSKEVKKEYELRKIRRRLDSQYNKK